MQFDGYFGVLNKRVISRKAKKRSVLINSGLFFLFSASLAKMMFLLLSKGCTKHIKVFCNVLNQTELTSFLKSGYPKLNISTEN